MPLTVLAVSPHLDDAALSAGARLADLASQGAHVHVATVFSGVPSDPLSDVAREFHDNCGLPHSEQAATIRLNEDESATRILGAQPHYAHLPDAVYRRTSDGNYLCQHPQAMFDDVPLDDALVERVSSFVNELSNQVRPDILMTSAGVGHHLDHRTTKAAVLHSAIASRADVMVWEDLPYAVGQDPVEPNGTMPVAKTAHQDSWNRRWRAIAAYPTQTRMLWPMEEDWEATLSRHAKTRGNGEPAELFWRVPCKRR